MRKLVTSAVALVAMAVFASHAMATPPTSSQQSFSGGGAIPAGALCSFPVQLDATQAWTSTQFYDQNGLITKDTARGTEQDTFSANGKTLVGDLYEFNIINEFVDGVFVSNSGAGIAERVPLPGGGVFIVAGRVNISAGAPVLTIDSGNSGNNLAAFCAALS